MRAPLIPVYALKFLIELVGWAGTGVLAFQLSSNWVLAIAVPIAVVVLWSIFIAPKAPRRMPVPPLVTCELIVFAAATAGFVLAEWTIAAIVFVVVTIPIEVALIATKSYDNRP
jgi:hypothetical protein